MADGVVDHFEIVKVKEQNGQTFFVLIDVYDGLGNPVAEQGSIGKIGKGVMGSQVQELGLVFFAIGDVLANGEDTF